MMKSQILKLHGAALKVLRGCGLTKNETINVGGLKYPVDEFLGYSDEKITDILQSAGATSEQVAQTFAWLAGLGSTIRERKSQEADKPAP